MKIIQSNEDHKYISEKDSQSDGLKNSKHLTLIAL